MKNKIRISTKNYNRSLVILLIVISVLLIFLTYFDIQNRKNRIIETTHLLETNINNEYKKRLEESILNTIKYIDFMYKFYLSNQKNGNDKLDKENYKLFENNIKKYLYENIHEEVRYTWINKVVDYNGGDNYAFRLIHPNLKNTEGIKLSTKTEDIKGNLPYLDELKGIVKDGEIYYSYYFKEYESENITKKLSYAKLYKNLDWIVATGIPLNVLAKKVNDTKKSMIRDFDNELKTTITIRISIFILLTLAVLYYRNKNTSYLFKNLSEANEILNESNEKLSLATKSAHIGIWKLNIKENILEWNEQMYSIYEIEKSSNNDLSLWLNCIFEDDLDDAKNSLQNAIENKTKYNNIFRIITKNGIKYIQAFGDIKYDIKGKAQYIIGVNFDITTIKSQEQTILNQAKSFSEHVIYSRTDKRGIITEASKAFCRISGYNESELIGKTHKIVRHPDNKNEIFKEMWKKLNNLEVWTGEIKNKRKDGTSYWVLSEISPEFDFNNNFIGYLSVRTDITYKKDLELKQIQLMEQSKLASLGEMIGNIAHQWRQPLSVISSAATGIKLQEELGTLDSKLLENELDMINDNAQYLSKTIDTFRNFIKEDKKLEEVVLQDRIKETFKILNASLNNNHIKLINKLDNTEPIKVKLILGELEQVIMNVINNSKDALLANKIVNPTIIIDIIRKENKVVLTLEDNAGGIKEDILPHIFEPYFTTKHKSQGTGLGLYMCFNIVKDSLKGNIYIKNTKIGAKTFIELPIENND